MTLKLLSVRPEGVLGEDSGGKSITGGLLCQSKMKQNRRGGSKADGELALNKRTLNRHQIPLVRGHAAAFWPDQKPPVRS